MFESTTHWSEHARNVATVLCNGLLAVRAERREQRRAAEAEAAVPPHWRIRPPCEPARPEPSESAQAAAEEPRRPASAEPPARMTIEPLTLPPPVAPWDMPRPPSSACCHHAGVRPPSRAARSAATTPVSSPSEPAPPPAAQATASATTRRPAAPQATSFGAAQPAEPQVNSDPRPCGVADPPSQQEAQLDLNFVGGPHGPGDELAAMAGVIGEAVNMLGEVVGDAVVGALGESLRSIEQRHVEDREHLMQHFGGALERQAARFEEALARQAENFAALMARHAEVQTENLRAMLRAVLEETAVGAAADTAGSSLTKAVEDLGETVRLGLGEVQAALDRHHHELIETVRAEVRQPARVAPPRFMPPPRPSMGASSVDTTVMSPRGPRSAETAADAPMLLHVPPLQSRVERPSRSVRIHADDNDPHDHPAGQGTTPPRRGSARAGDELYAASDVSIELGIPG